MVWRSDEVVRLNNGTCTMHIPTNTIRDIKLMRLFFENEENYYLFRFIHPLYRRD